MGLTKIAALELLHEMVDNQSLIRHCVSVGMVLEHYAKIYNENPEEWAVTGILHDADYDRFPVAHPKIIVEKLRNMGEDKIAHAISAHYTKWNVPYNTLLDKALLACDELTGFIVAAALIRPEKIEGLTVKSVKKKLKSKKFAAGVERSEVTAGVELLEVALEEHIQTIIDVLYANKHELNLVAS